PSTSILLASYNAERLGNLRQDICRLQKLFSFMPGTDNRSQPGLAFGHRRIPHRGRKYPGVEQLARKLECLCRVPDMDWNDRRLAGLELEATLFQLALQKLGIGPQLLHEFFAFGRIE